MLKQLKADLIGKDSYRGATLTYSWLANQFGHFSLGYIPSLIAYAFLRSTAINNPAFWAAIIVSCLWLLFEMYNFLGPLLSKSHTQAKFLFIAGKKYTFQPAWTNVAFDTFTDLCFFWLGAFSASLFLNLFSYTIYVLGFLVLILIYPIGYWFVTKMYIQYARLPVQFRLSQWEGDLSDTDKDLIIKFVKSPRDTHGRHLLIFGGRRSGKSLLSIGIATEMAIRRFTCFYYTGMKIYNLFSLTDREIIESEKCDKWSWRTASLLVIDDINPGSPIARNFVTPQQILQLIDTPVGDNNKKNREDLINKNVVWVMGDENDGVSSINDWVQMLLNIGIPETQISIVNRGFNTL